MIKKILLIDDDEEDFLITEDLLEEIPRKDYQLDWVPTYEEALEQIGKKEHDIYLVDYRLGTRDGLSLISEANATFSDLPPFILLTGQGDTDTDEKALHAGAVDFLVKGNFSSSELERSIRYSYAHHSNMAEIRMLNSELEKRVKERTLELAETVEKLENSNHNLQDQIRVRKIAEEALRESQNLYSTIAHNFPNGTINVLDRNLRFVFVDGKELSEINMSSKDIVGKTVADIFEDVEAASFVASQYLRVFSGEIVNFDVALWGRQYVFHATPLPGTTDEISQILVVAENITERKKAEEEMIKMLEKEKELNELKSRFVTMASHEFRTPLSTILSSSSLISRYENTSDQGKRLKHVNRIKSNVNHLNRLLNDFLSLGKLEEGKVMVHPEYFDPVAHTESVVEELSLSTLSEQNILLNSFGEPTSVFLDKQLIKNILINLMSNAVKYSPNGKDVELELHFTEETFAIKIIDHGIGIPEQEQVHLFERFFRAKNTTNIQGTGLGLNIVKRYVDLMNGNIDFYSKLNVGTTVTITFPLELGS
ncbi:ATP-binding protein [Flammeovirgaceae bacterium SG7u.111]|nr:ATP-binding protein [Flammeovirgaceae bacterium SG7u.132]WPO33983.1 ATP-binding protein [Flammeovirgaceae bacterium SG7u.111]